MHAVVMESLEEYLAGALEPVGQREIEAHLSGCALCRSEVEEMREFSQLFGSLRAGEVPEPASGFFVRVLEQIGAEKGAPSFAGMFAFDFAFGRRLVFASLVMLAVLGGFLVARESGYPAGPGPEAVMAQENTLDLEAAPSPDNMLVTLASYGY
jgi:anti-sigma factor RsiW